MAEDPNYDVKHLAAQRWTHRPRYVYRQSGAGALAGEDPQDESPWALY